jgi:WD40 repeat protein/tRNA A-37 threonylcarbamoyl transferase component Bud32
MAKKPNDAEAIFNAAVNKRPGAERSAYLDAACGDDTVLRARIETLLKAHEHVGDYLEVPAVDPNATLDDPPVIEGPGTKIGRYELLELIGEGGMGLVYLAQQKKPVKRRVALKIIKPGMDSKQVIARFEAERQTLAVLDHPNVAHVLDAGTTREGRPYFIMEYVKGLSVTKYCDEHKLNIEQRLRLFEQVCEGVHHAHQKGIIHRDLKPSNILVSVHGDRAVPKIIDFGIAKAVTQPLTEKTFVTFQGQLLGTPEYMSPEQVDLATQDIDTRSDIYSLGVVLYELLAGVLPFERDAFASLGFAEVQRTIREQEPASPSTRLTNLGQEAKTIAASRSTQVVALARRLHRELEWIPLKAMRKDRCRRYRWASEMADDVRNYLNGLPLIAGPETAVYRTRKFVRKHAGSVATVALVTLAIVLGLVVSVVMGCRAEQARQQEASARAQVEQALARAEEAEQAAREKSEELRRTLYVNSIQLADARYGEANMRRVHELLESCPDDLRGWEWHRLNHIMDQSLMTFRGHSDGVLAMAISPDGKRVVSGSDDKIIKTWDSASGDELMTFRGHDDWISSVAFSPDGKRIISGSGDDTIKVWDSATGAELMTLRGHGDCVNSVAFSPDGKRIASGSIDKTIKVWNAANGDELMTIRGHERQIGPVLFSPDGRRIISGSMDWTVWNQTIKVWDATTGAELMTLYGHDYYWINSIDISPDGKRIISGGSDSMIKVWDPAAGDEIMTLRGHKLAVAEVAFSPDGKRIVSGSNDGTIKVWDVSTGTELMTLLGHRDEVCSVAFSPDGMHIISSSKDKTIKVWDNAIRAEAVTLSGLQGTVFSMAFSPDSKRFLSGGSGNTVTVWNVETGTELMMLRGHDNWVVGASFSPDGKRIASGSTDKTIKIWDATNGAELMTLRGDNWFGGPSFSPDGRRIVCSSNDNKVRVWDAATGEELMVLHGHEGRCVTFSPDGKQIVLGSRDGMIIVWDASTGAEVMTFRGHSERIWSVMFSPDGKRIVSGSSVDPTVRVWDAGSGAELLSLPSDGPVLSVAFSPDGKRIISGSMAGTVKVWDSATGAALMTLREHSDRIWSVAFSPDGKTIAAGTETDDDSIKLWESTTPVGGHEARRTGKVAKTFVEKLHEQHSLYSKVIDKLKADKTLDESVRKIALQIANARLWEDEEKTK